MICDVCGRHNADNLTFCQDCGRRLRQQRGVAPTPPSGMPRVELPRVEPISVSDGAPDSGRGSSPSGPPSGGRRARPAAPAFSFGPSADNLAEVPRAGPLPLPLPEPRAAASAPAPVPAREKPAQICTECHTSNPPEYRFCVTCGAPLRRAVDQPSAPAATARPAAVAERAEPRREPPTAPRYEPAPPMPSGPSSGFDGEQIVGAPVVDIASSISVPAKILSCSRCRGHCLAGTRFCKYCGAPLDDTAAQSGRRAAMPPPTPPPAPVAEDRERPLSPPPPPPPSPHSNGGPPRVDPHRADLVGRVPLSPISRPGAQQPARPQVPQAAAPAIPAPIRPLATPSPPRPDAAGAAGAVASHEALQAHPAPALVKPREHDVGARSEVSVMAGSPIPSEPLHFPHPPAGAPRAMPGRWQGGRLVVIVEDGTEGRSFSLAEGQLDVGRTDGDIVLEDDPYVSPRHARLRRVDGAWMLRDLDSTNHVYVRLRKSSPLKDGDLLLLGLEVLQFQTVSDGERGLGHAIQHGTFLFGSPATPRRGRLCQRTVEGVIRDVYHLFRDETVIGREVGDIVFTADPFLSRRHAAIRRNPVTSEFSLVDLDSSNGTYVAIRGEVGISDGDFLRIGQHLFRVDLG